MDEDLPPLLRVAILDRLEGWELVEFLQIDIERVLEAFEEDVAENIEDVYDLVDLRKDDEDEG